MRDFIAALRLKPDYDLDALLRHAAAHSRFYRERLRPGRPLTEQPVRRPRLTASETRARRWQTRPRSRRPGRRARS